jgi:microcystin-dependent protein
MSFILPNTITNGASRDARPVQANFAAIADALQNDYVRVEDLPAPGDPVTGDTIPVGVIMDYSGAAAPTGWVLCQGQLINKSENPQLWTLLGNTYGTSTATQFYVPDLRSVFTAGKGTASWSSSLNQKGGSKDAVVIGHSHSYSYQYRSVSSVIASGANFGYNPNLTTVGGNTSYEGSAGTDRNLPPYVTLNKIIKTG